MADPKKPTETGPQKPFETATQKPAETGANDELAAARSRVAELERALAERDDTLDAQRREIANRDLAMAEQERRFDARERDFDEALARARREPARRIPGTVIRMRAKHTLYFQGADASPRKVVAGKEFDASPEELMRAELVEGIDFDRVAG